MQLGEGDDGDNLLRSTRCRVPDSKCRVSDYIVAQYDAGTHRYGWLESNVTVASGMKTKLENPGKPAIFVGYAKVSISYRILDARSRAIEELITVEFVELWTIESQYIEKLLLNR